MRIDSEKEDFDSFRTINEIFRHLKQSNEETVINKLSIRLLGLEFTSDNIVKSKAMEFLLKKYYLIISNIV